MKNPMKKFIHKFIIDEKGAVSIFLIMIALLLFIFNAVLIDFARIFVAERQTEEAAKVALRSTMSSYRQSLQDHGLFSFDGDEGEATTIFQEVFHKNISPAEEGNFELLGLQSEDAELSLDMNSARSLANKEILRYQILEEMKYKAPIEVGEAILSNFLSISDKVEQASNYAKIAKEINEMAEERDEILDDIETLLQDAIDALDAVEDFVEDEHGPTGTYPNITTTNGIFGFHDRYKRELEAIKDAENAESCDDEADEENEDCVEIDEEEIAQFRYDTRVYKQEAVRILEDILNAARIAHSKVVEAMEKLRTARDINSDIVTKIGEPSDSTEDNYNNANEIAESTAEGGVEGEVDMATLDSFAMDDELFDEVEALLVAAERHLNSDSIQTNALIQKINVDILPTVRSDFRHRARTDILRDRDRTFEYYHHAYDNIDEALTTLRQGMEDHLDDVTDAEMEAEEENAEEALGDAEDEMERIEDEIGEYTSDTNLLRQLNVKATNYGEASASNEQEFSFEDRDETSDQAMSFIDLIFKGIGDVLVGARDEVYVNEYILFRFNSHDFVADRPEKYSYDNNQVEYIIYGLDAYGANHMAAMSEIFAVRFAINFTHSLMKPQNKVFGPFVWLAVLTEAFGSTAEDMVDISNGDPVQLFPGARSLGTMDYKDHLRLFLFLHPEGAKFHRLMAVLDKEASVDLNDTATYVTADATTSIRLWFLPQIADMLERADVISGRVEGNRFFIEKEVNFSY